MKFKIVMICLFISNLMTAQEKRVYYADKNLAPRERFVDFTHLQLKLAFEPKEKLVKGAVKHEFEVLRKELDSLFLDGVKMRYREVTHNGDSVQYKASDKGITIYFKNSLKWGEKHSISISYEANTVKGIYFIGWNDETNRSRKQIWTQGQGIDNRHWIPMYDERNDKLVSEIIVTFDESYEVLSNGVLLEKKRNPIQMKPAMNQWHYKISHPHAPYLIMLGIGEYGIERKKSAFGVPLNLYYYPDQPEQVNSTYLHSVKMFDFFEKEIGVPYPWETYSQIPVQDFMYGAMENTTATIFGDFYLVDEREFLDRNYVRVDAHELAHQWFGDMVTARSAAHHWLQESFATHYDLIYQKEAFGQNHFDWTRRKYNNQALEASLKDLKPVAHSEGGTVRHYPKGAHVLQMLKYVVGREQFNAAIKYYLEKHPYQNVDSDDLLTAFHEKLGLSLDWFWEQWVYKGGEPHYQVDFNAKKGKGTFRVEQIHDLKDLTSNFKMPIYFEVHYKDGSSDSRKVWIEKDTTEVSFDLNKRKVDYVLFDPNSEIMKKVSFTKPVKMLKAQAEKAKYMLDRYDAYEAMDSLKFKGKEEFMIQRYYAEEFHATKGILIGQILKYNTGDSEEAVKDALQHKSVDVRKAVLYNTSKWDYSLASAYKVLLSDSSYQIIADALEVFTYLNSSKAQEYLDLTKGIEGNRAHNVIVTWLKLDYYINKTQTSFDKLIDYTSDSFEFLTRVKAMQALAELNTINEAGIKNVIQASLYFNSTLRGKARATFNQFYKQEDYRTLIDAYIDSNEWTERETRILNKMRAKD